MIWDWVDISYFGDHSILMKLFFNIAFIHVIQKFPADDGGS